MSHITRSPCWTRLPVAGPIAIAVLAPTWISDSGNATPAAASFRAIDTTPYSSSSLTPGLIAASTAACAASTRRHASLIPSLPIILDRFGVFEESIEGRDGRPRNRRFKRGTSTRWNSRQLDGDPFAVQLDRLDCLNQRGERFGSVCQTRSAVGVVDRKPVGRARIRSNCLGQPGVACQYKRCLLKPAISGGVDEMGRHDVAGEECDESGRGNQDCIHPRFRTSPPVHAGVNSGCSAVVSLGVKLT